MFPSKPGTREKDTKRTGAANTAATDKLDGLCCRLPRRAKWVLLGLTRITSTRIFPHSITTHFCWGHANPQHYTDNTKTKNTLCMYVPRTIFFPSYFLLHVVVLHFVEKYEIGKSGRSRKRYEWKRSRTTELSFSSRKDLLYLPT